MYSVSDPSLSANTKTFDSTHSSYFTRSWVWGVTPISLNAHKGHLQRLIRSFSVFQLVTHINNVPLGKCLCQYWSGPRTYFAVIMTQLTQVISQDHEFGASLPTEGWNSPGWYGTFVRYVYPHSTSSIEQFEVFFVGTGPTRPPLRRFHKAPIPAKEKVYGSTFMLH